MRLGSMIVGGLIGAGIVMMVQRNPTMSSVTSGMGREMRSKMKGMRNEVLAKAMNMKFMSGAKRDRGSPGKGEQSFGSDAEHAGEIERLASMDPTVSRQINDILEQSEDRRN